MGTNPGGLRAGSRRPWGGGVTPLVAPAGAAPNQYVPLHLQNQPPHPCFVGERGFHREILGSGFARIVITSNYYLLASCSMPLLTWAPRAQNEGQGTLGQGHGARRPGVQGGGCPLCGWERRGPRLGAAAGSRCRARGSSSRPLSLSSRRNAASLAPDKAPCVSSPGRRRGAWGEGWQVLGHLEEGLAAQVLVWGLPPTPAGEAAGTAPRPPSGSLRAWRMEAGARCARRCASRCASRCAPGAVGTNPAPSSAPRSAPRTGN